LFKSPAAPTRQKQEETKERNQEMKEEWILDIRELGELKPMFSLPSFILFLSLSFHAPLKIPKDLWLLLLLLVAVWSVWLLFSA